MYKIIYDKGKQLKKDKEKINKNLQDKEKIIIAIEKLAKLYPNISNIKRLEPKKNNKYRLRIGNYRVIFRVDFGNEIITIYRIGLRKDIYES